MNHWVHRNVMRTINDYLAHWPYLADGKDFSLVEDSIRGLGYDEKQMELVIVSFPNYAVCWMVIDPGWPIPADIYTELDRRIRIHGKCGCED